MYAADCRPYGSAFAAEAKILFVEDGFEKFALPLRKNDVGRSGRAPLFLKSTGGHGRSCGRVHAINARRAEPASKSLKGPHCTGILLQYPTPRFPRTSMSRIVLPKSSSSTIVTSRNSRRHASSGRSPVLTAKST